MVFAIIWEMFHWKISLNAVLLLLLVNFVSGFRLESLYISLIISIRPSFTHLHGFQLLVLLPQFMEITFFDLYQQNKSSECKVKFRKLVIITKGFFKGSLALFLLFSVIDCFGWFWMGSIHKNIQLILEFLKAPFLVLHYSCYTLMIFLTILFVLLVSILLILLSTLSTLSVIRHLICGNS